MNYLLFQGDTYYPNGGFSDFTGCYSTIEECREAARSDWYEIVDLNTLEKVESGGCFFRYDAEDYIKRYSPEVGKVYGNKQIYFLSDSIVKYTTVV